MTKCLFFVCFSFAYLSIISVVVSVTYHMSAGKYFIVEKGFSDPRYYS